MKSLRHRRFPVNFMNFSRMSFVQNASGLLIPNVPYLENTFKSNLKKNKTLCDWFESRWMSVELVRYVKTVIAICKFYSFFVSGINWWNGHVTKIHSKLCNTTTFENWVRWILLRENIECPELINVFWYCLK